MLKFRHDASAVMANYQSALRAVRELTGFSPQQVLLAEAGVVLKTWAGRTKVGTEETAESKERRKVMHRLGYTKAAERGDVTVNSGWRPAPFGRVWIRVRTGNGRQNFLLARGADFSSPAGSGIFPNPRAIHGHGTVKWIGNVNDAVQDVQAALKLALPRARASVGLSRQSVIQIADKLGIDLNNVQGGGTISAAGIAKARASIASNGRAYQNGQGYTAGDSIKAYVDLICTLPWARNIGMDTTLLGVIAGRSAYITKVYDNTVTTTQAEIARRFPNLLRVTAN